MGENKSEQKIVHNKTTVVQLLMHVSWLIINFEY